ncbi:DUF4176 domain-containing protein [Virgibacillus dakarensis]|uniref:DUF4176 domain-containing protein n=1 Tax=Virgibacillus dakarensis TaxID=1917889 RepID=UPI00190F015A|nr:DUF4176 domain-containing protein [Virgibacillus dakarensis]MBT2214618.1 DUF4176 domain-containing protein [Virgibacillus dakarensis]
MLPIGSVVLLHDGEQKLMITGRKPIVETIRKEEVYMDYIACIYPSGVLDENVYFFNQEDIAEVIFTGYAAEEEAEIARFIKDWEELTPLKKGKINDELLVE